MDKKSVAQLHKRINEGISKFAYVMLADYDSDELVLDGRFTLEQLSHIVETWRQYKDEQPTPVKAE